MRAMQIAYLIQRVLHTRLLLCAHPPFGADGESGEATAEPGFPENFAIVFLIRRVGMPIAFV